METGQLPEDLRREEGLLRRVEGFGRTPDISARLEIDRLTAGLVVAYPDVRFAPTFGRLAAALRRGRGLIQTMDLLIATSALLDDAPLVTRNVKDFSRVPGLRVLEY